MSDVEAGGLDQAVESAEGAVSEGQTEAAPEETSPFFQHEWDDGKVDVFNSADELRDWMKNSSLRHSDYTRKTQQLAEARKAAEQARSDFENEKRTFNESYSKIMEMDKFLKENPSVSEEIAQRMRGRTGNADVERLVKEATKPFQDELSQLKEAEARRAEEAARNRAFEAVAGKYKDFNRNQIESAIRRIDEIPKERQLEALVDMIYHAERSRGGLGEIERKAAMTGSKAKPPPATGTIKEPQGTPKSRDEEIEIALKAMEAASS